MNIKHRQSTAFYLLVSLGVALGQPVIDTQPSSLTNIAGTTATFSVTATGTPPLAYQWAFGSPPVSLDGATDSTLVLPNVHATNQGPYEVVVTNMEGSVTSVVANLYVVAPPTLQFGASSYTVPESAGNVTLTIERTGWLATALSVDYTTADGTAIHGVKYTAVSGTLAFGPGETNKTIVVPILNEGFVEGTKYFRVILSNPIGGAVLGTRANVGVSITDNDVGFQVAFATYSVSEDAGAVLIGVVRGDDGTPPVTVNFATTDGTAKNGADYTGTTNTLSFASHEWFKWRSVPILNNNLKQPNRTFRVSLANPVGASLGSPSSAIVTIVDNDQGFQFGSASYSVLEDAGVARIDVLRGTDDTNSAVTVDYTTSDGSASNGLDYTGTTKTLSFAPGETRKLVTVPILNNGIRQVTRNFRLILSTPTGGGALGAPTTTTVSILDNDPGLSFEQPRYTNAWGNTSGITVTVLRGNDWALEPITVDYATSDATAKVGVDYEPSFGTLEFQATETAKTLTIPLLRNRAAEGTKYFRVSLSNATGGATLGAASTSLYIVGAYFTVSPPFDTALTIQRDGGQNILTWAGSGQLQRADSPIRPWQTLTNAHSPYAVKSPIPATFYRVTRPRPANVYVPSSYDGQRPVSLVLLLHWLGGTGSDEENYMQLRPLAEERGFLFCYPDGTIGPDGVRFWNGTDACCDHYGTGVDDAGYLRALIEEIGRQFAVDRKRVFLIGHSNGGFMVYRMACESADLIAGIASLAGATFLDPSLCHPSQPVNILHIQGTADMSIPYASGPEHPGAIGSVQIWAGYNGAHGPVTDPMPSMDLSLDVPGLDTVITCYTNSPPGGAVELWTINGGSHSPTLHSGNSSSELAPRVIDWLLAHPKP